MDSEKLIKMANQIGDFFEANPNAEEAKKEIANHLKKFWNSVMIQGIVTHVTVEARRWFASQSGGCRTSISLLIYFTFHIRR